MSLDDILAQVDATLDARLCRLFELIRLPSVSTDPAHAKNCRAAADWLARDLAAIGFEASVRDTAGQPMVVAHGPAAPGPRVLFYGHYDVQPADPLDLWNSDPFAPVPRPGRGGETHIVGRGASDDKGARMTFAQACRAWTEVRGALPLRVSILFEGEEESGSRSIASFL